MSSIIQKMAYYLLPRSLRKLIIKTMIGAEQAADPKEATKLLLGVYDYVNYEIDAQCKRWGDGVHIKHEVMEGIHSIFYDRIERNASVLDLDCGYGALAHANAIHTDAKVFAIDFDAKQIEFEKNVLRIPIFSLLLVMLSRIFLKSTLWMSLFYQVFLNT